MSLDLDWEILAVRGLRALWRRLVPKRRAFAIDERAARLEEEKERLELFARFLAAVPVRVQRARGAGGIRGLDLLLPPQMSVAASLEENRRLYLARTALCAVAVRLGQGWKVPADPLERALLSLRAFSDARAALEEELQASAKLLEEAAALALVGRPSPDELGPRASLLEKARRAALHKERPFDDPALLAALRAARHRGEESPPLLLFGELIPVEAGEAGEVGASDAEASPPTSDATCVEAPPIEEVRRVTLDEEEQKRAVLMHTFEKIETLDSFRGGARDTDGADELEGHLEALEEVDLGALLRGGEQASSILRADIALDAGIPDVARIDSKEEGIPYDEWDFRKRRYREGWCTVFPTRVLAADEAWTREALARYRPVIDLLEARLLRFRAARRRRKRQLDGEDVDIDALVEERAALAAGAGGSARLYEWRERQRRAFATCVLLDISLSSDAWVEDRRVLDVAREAVLVLGEVAYHLGDDLEVLAFASHTRNRCRVFSVRRREEPWPTARARLGALVPQGYTRIGPALRHATRVLSDVPADRRLLLLVTDGKPTDYDRYEGRYGIEDVRQALREAEARGVVTHALAIDRSSRRYLSTMFGTCAFHLLPHPARLPEAMTTVWGRLTA